MATTVKSVDHIIKSLVNNNITFFAIISIVIVIINQSEPTMANPINTINFNAVNSSKSDLIVRKLLKSAVIGQATVKNRNQRDYSDG
ncbi:MAG: hypothetical protein O7C56_06820 [Rickettsia endosymbiont of Ixodes persulcatus]|nr:hypothetical protein [Rickettsia endosymbiont of Ixodes persulcatus]